MPPDNDPVFPPVVLTFAASDPSGAGELFFHLLELPQHRVRAVVVVRFRMIERVVQTAALEAAHGA